MKANRNIGFLFDLDGVLIDSETEYTRIWKEIDEAFPTGVDNFAIRIKGMTLPEILHKYFKKIHHQEVVDMLNEREQKMTYTWLPGALETLKKLRENNLGCILVTSSNNMKMKHLHEELPDLGAYFKDIVTADRISRSKPHPEGYLLGASLLSAPARRCAVFEDSRQGVMAGKAAHAFVVGLATTLRKEDIVDYCDMTVDDLSEVNIDRLAEILDKR